MRNDLRQPTLEEVGYRTAVFSLEGVTGSQREYMEWVLGTCVGDRAKVDGVLDPAAVALLASRLCKNKQQGYTARCAISESTLLK